MRRLLRIHLHSFTRSQLTMNRWPGCTAPIASPAQPSSFATLAASVRWSRPSPHPPIPLFHSMDNECSSPAKRNRKTRGRSGRFRWLAEPRGRSRPASEDCVRPFYLPEDRVVYARRNRWSIRDRSRRSGGGKPLPLTYGPANFLPTDVLRDGRILFEAAYPHSEPAPFLKSIPSIPMAAASNPIAAITAKLAILVRQVALATLFLLRNHGLARFTSAQGPAGPDLRPRWRIRWRNRRDLLRRLAPAMAR